MPAGNTHRKTEDWIRRIAWIGKNDDPCKVASEAAALMRELLDQQTELLAALKEVVTNGEGFDGRMTDWRISGDVYAMAEEAVSKAEGNQMADSYEFLKSHYDRGQSEQRSAIEVQRDELLAALRGLLNVIAADDLVPESVSYMRQARATLAKAEGN